MPFPSLDPLDHCSCKTLHLKRPIRAVTQLEEPALLDDKTLRTLSVGDASVAFQTDSQMQLQHLKIDITSGLLSNKSTLLPLIRTFLAKCAPVRSITRLKLAKLPKISHRLYLIRCLI